MIFSIAIADASEEDLRMAYHWYKEQNEKLANNFEMHFSKGIDSIQKNPFKTQVRYKSIRVFFLKKFPYGIHFKVEDTTILIVAVFHTSMNPRQWKKR
jgi:plasmid stabilization system protein ParE